MGCHDDLGPVRRNIWSLAPARTLSRKGDPKVEEIVINLLSWTDQYQVSVRPAGPPDLQRGEGGPIRKALPQRLTDPNGFQNSMRDFPGSVVDDHSAKALTSLGTREVLTVLHTHNCPPKSWFWNLEGFLVS